MSYLLRISTMGLLVAACTEVPALQDERGDADAAWTGPVQPTLEANRLLGGHEDFGHVLALVVVDDAYLLVGDDATERHLMVLDIKSGEVVSRFGGHGDGPYEFRQPFRITPDPLHPDTWWVYDFATWNWTPVSMREGPTDWTIGERYSFNGAPIAPETPMWAGEDVAVVHGMFSEFSVARVSFDSDRRHVSDWSKVENPQPFTREDMPQETGLRFLNRSYVAMRPSGGRFALAYQFDNWIEVRDGDGTVVRKLRGPREARTSYRLDEGGRFHWEDDNESGYLAAYGTEGGFYLLWKGSADGPVTTIHQFDWSGSFVREFGVDHSLLSFAVSSTGDRLWGFLRQGLPYPAIGEWVLP